MSQGPYDYTTRRGLRPISWEDFHGICKALAVAVADFRPEVILSVGRGGYYPGTLLAHILQLDLFPVYISRRVRDVPTFATPRWVIEPPAAIAGRRVLIVDEICSTGETLGMVKERTEALGASDVRTAVLYAHTKGLSIPDYVGLASDALLLNPWDREILKDGDFLIHPEYAAALAQQGLEPGPHLRIAATDMTPAKRA